MKSLRKTASAAALFGVLLTAEQARAVVPYNPWQKPSLCTRLLGRVSNRVQLYLNLFQTSRVLRTDFKDRRFRINDSYEGVLGPEFIDDIKSLGGDQHFVDFGFGRGQGVRQYYLSREFGGNASITGIALTPPKGLDLGRFERELPHGKFRHIFGALQDNAGRIAPADLAADVFGPLHYAEEDLADVLKQELSTLKVGGKLYTNALNRTNITDNRGLRVWPREWMSRIRGAKLLPLSEGFVKTWKMDPRSAPLVLQRTNEPLVIPPLVWMGIDAAGAPPSRRYRTVDLPYSDQPETKPLSNSTIK